MHRSEDVENMENNSKTLHSLDRKILMMLLRDKTHHYDIMHFEPRLMPPPSLFRSVSFQQPSLIQCPPVSH